MESFIALNRYLHVVLGFAGLAAWWVPILTAKGGRRHRQFGLVFVAAAWVVGATAIASPILHVTAARLDGASWAEVLRGAGFLVFLAYLGLFTLDAVYYGVRVLRTRRDPARLAAPLLTAAGALLVLGSVVVAIHALVFRGPTSIILLLLSPIGVLQAHGQWQYARQPPKLRRAWFYEHMDAMLGAGVAFHTAFLVFGSRVVLDLTILGPFNWVPWVLPAVVAAVAGGRWQRAYMRRFGDLPPNEARAAAG